MAITYFTYASILDYGEDMSYVYFVGSATLLLYSLHRIIGIRKSHSYANQGRFAIIINYRSHLIIYSIISGLYCLYAFYTFDWTRRLLLFIPAIISLSYSLPIFLGGRRLRDFHWIKIFLVAICWAVITCTIPYIESGKFEIFSIVLYTLERALFIFAITIPFDIRDRDIDRHSNVDTLATAYSDKQIKSVALLALITSAALSLYLHYRFAAVASVITYIISSILVVRADEKKSDYYYTGWVDGVMILPIVLLCALVILQVLVFGIEK